MKIKLKYFILVIIGISLIYLYPFIKNMYKAEANNISVQKHLFAEYKGLLKNLQKGKIDSNSEFTYYYKETPPISIFKYDSLYSILVYKIETKNIENLDSSLIFLNLPAKEALGQPYSGIEDSYAFKFLAEKPPLFQSIVFSLYGDSVKAIKRNDSSASYFAHFSNFSIRTEKHEKSYIYGKATTKDKLPICILFKKRGATVYMLTMTQNNTTKKSFPINLLSDLVDSSGFQP